MKVLTYSTQNDTEDYLYLDSDGNISVEEDGSSARTYPLTKKEAINLASKLLQYGTRK